jgi:PIN domain nuclease of toxin-antitoxin system
MGRILLDTDVFGWYITEHSRLPEKCRNEIYYSDVILVSRVSFWELAIKEHDGKIWLDPPLTLEAVIDHSVKYHNITVLPLEDRHLKYLAKMPVLPNHRESFDRLIIATALAEGIRVATSDEEFPNYSKLDYLLCRPETGRRKGRNN